MNAYKRRLVARFEPEARFDLAPVPAAPFRGVRETELECLKDRLLREKLSDAPAGELYAPYRRAANEAAALAWTTAFPLLFFPALFEEKTREAARHLVVQESIRRRSGRLLGAAA